MYKAVIDASALLAFLKDESISLNELETILPHSLLSSVNACEVATVMIRVGMPSEVIEALIHETVGDVIAFDRELSLAAAKLWETTKAYGLSLGDRACLALAQQRDLPVYTADKVWSKLQLEDLQIKLIR